MDKIISRAKIQTFELAKAKIATWEKVLWAREIHSFYSLAQKLREKIFSLQIARKFTTG